MPKQRLITVAIVVVLLIGSVAWYFLGGPMPPFGPWRYIASASSTRFHDPSCVWAGQINERVFFATRGGAEAKGYDPCPTCLGYKR